MKNGREENIIEAPTVPVGKILRGFRLRDGLTQAQLAAHLSVPTCRVSRMERGLEPIQKDMAERLAVFFQERSTVFM